MRRFLVVLVALVALLALVSGLTLYFNPVGIALWWARVQMTSLGLEKKTLQAPRGLLTWFEGGPEEPPFDGGDTVVLVHGMGDHAATWVRIVPELMRRHRLLIPDLPGHGESAPRGSALENGSLTLADERAGLEALLDARTEGPVVLVGNSMGGWISMLVARDRPEKVARLVLINSGGLSFESRVPALPETREEARAMVTAVLGPDAGREIPGFFLDDLVDKVQAGPAPRLVASFPEADLLDGELDRVRVPTEVIWGELDEVFPPDYVRRLVEGLPAARYHALPECAHSPQITCPGLLAELLSNLLEEPPAPVPSDVATPEPPVPEPVPAPS
jgi:pimeloyl-ACP methyl ester carboxylesterase